jgi:glycosyltransferase involved in cell wall biosynthesis
MITHNHERFTAQILDSVLMQQIDWDYDIVVGEDCSTDNTRYSAVTYKKRVPGTIKQFLAQGALGMTRNFVQTTRVCQGQYIAFLEGDYYWTAPHKLQKQVDSPDGHPGAMCFHNVELLNEETQEHHLYFGWELKPIYALDDLARGSGHVRK